MTSGITIMLGILSLVFIAAYPAMKRITWWPQAFLGITFNFGVLMGWSAAVHELRLEAIILCYRPDRFRNRCFAIISMDKSTLGA